VKKFRVRTNISSDDAKQYVYVPKYIKLGNAMYRHSFDDETRTDNDESAYCTPTRRTQAIVPHDGQRHKGVQKSVQLRIHSLHMRVYKKPTQE
jgi:hypothetical protein